MISLLSLLAAPTVTASPFLSPLFSDHMVLQRGRANTFWGWSAPGSHIVLSIAGHSTEGSARKDGKWEIKFLPPDVGGPYELRVSGEKSVILRDVMVGDVWLCSGQSNMEFGLSMADTGKADVATSENKNLRLFMVPRAIGFTPQTLSRGEWLVSNPKNVATGGWNGFSAVGYYFGSKLQHDLNVPIGLVESSWGGTSAEAWTEPNALRPLKDFDRDIQEIESMKTDPPIATYIELWLRKNDPGSNPSSSYSSANVNDADWGQVALPALGSIEPFNDHSGVYWFRTTFEALNTQTGAGQIALGAISDLDTVWINGQQIGSGSGQWDRHYPVPAGTVHQGQNEVAIRLVAPSKPDGFLGREKDMYIGASNGTNIPLAGFWKYKAGPNFPGLHPPKNIEGNPTIPGTLYNGMIAPITPFAMRGAIWYQGETNGGRGFQYGKILPAMIRNWRKEFEQSDFAFYIVSLANWGQRRDKPGDDSWAELREAQARTAETVGNSGLALAIDVGAADNIHPTDKRTVAERLALNALALTYKQKIVYSGPVFKSLKLEGDQLVVSLDFSKGLVLKGDASQAFQVAGADHVWHWAIPEVVGEQIKLTSDSVPHPVAARYAWQMNPEAPLYNGANLPAVPFRTDNWPEISREAK